jgi:hypothetical protein
MASRFQRIIGTVLKWAGMGSALIVTNIK